MHFPDPSSEMETTSLLIVTVALPVELKLEQTISRLINDFITPQTLDSAVYKRFRRVVRVHRATKPWTMGAMDGAAANGELRMVLWLCTNRSEGCSDKAMTAAAANGHLGVVEVLWGEYPHLCRPGDAIQAATANGHAAIVEFLLDKCPPRDIGAAFVTAASSGHLDVMKLLPSNRYAKAKAMRRAATNGHAQVLEYLFRTSAAVTSIYADPVLVFAAEGGFIDVVQLVLSSCGSVAVGNASCARALEAAALNEHLDVTKLLLERCRHKELGFVVEKVAAKILLNVVELLVDAYEPLAVCFEGDGYIETGLSSDAGEMANLNASCCVSQALYLAATSNSVELVKLLAAKAHTCVVGAAMAKAAEYGFINVVEVLVEHVEECTVHGTLVTAVKYDLKLSRTDGGYLSSNTTKLLSDDSGLGSIASGLTNAAMNGYTEVVELLLAVCSSYIRAFSQQWCAASDRSWMAKALGRDLESIVIDRAIQASAEVGRVEILKLLPLEKTHQLYLRDAFTKAEVGRHDDVLEWLRNKTKGAADRRKTR